MPQNSYTYDNLLLLKDAGAVTATGAGTVGGQARVLDLGPANLGDARAIVDVSVMDTADSNETYRVSIQGSNDITFATGVAELGSVLISGTGRSEIPFSNVQAGVTYRYAREYHTLAGTTPSINYTAFIAKD